MNIIADCKHFCVPTVAHNRIKIINKLVLWKIQAYIYKCLQAQCTQ